MSDNAAPRGERGFCDECRERRGHASHDWLWSRSVVFPDMRFRPWCARLGETVFAQ